jgi:DnaJ-domain-containing protein 1
MSLFQRIYDLAKAEANRHAERIKPHLGKTHKKWKKWTSTEGATSSNRSSSSYHYKPPPPPPPRTPPGQDPVLAAHYAALEVPYGSDLATVKKAWKTLLRRYHPDLHGKTEEKRKTAEELTRGLNQAYEALEKHLSK